MNQNFRGHAGLPSSRSPLRTGSMVRRGEDRVQKKACSRCHSRRKKHSSWEVPLTGLPESWREYLTACGISEEARRRMRVKCPLSQPFPVSTVTCTLGHLNLQTHVTLQASLVQSEHSSLPSSLETASPADSLASCLPAVSSSSHKVGQPSLVG